VTEERPEGLDWPEPSGSEPPPDEAASTPPAPTAAERTEGTEGTDEGAVALLGRDLLVPIRSSSGLAPDPDGVTLEGMRHGSDEHGRFLAAFSSDEAFRQLGPPGSDRVAVRGRELLERAERAGERVIVDPGWNGQVEIPAGVLPFLVAGIDLASPAALRARRPLGSLPPLELPASVPEPFGGELRMALAELPAVQRAWLLRVGTAWTVGIELHPDAPLSEFDAVRNRLHALAAEHLGSRRDLVVTDLRAPALRAHYESVAPPYYVPSAPKGFLARLLGRD
jgi:SseB protein N-terminal domain